jgi:hypothetical protein
MEGVGRWVDSSHLAQMGCQAAGLGKGVGLGQMADSSWPTAERKRKK